IIDDRGEGRTYNTGLLQCWLTQNISSVYLYWALVPADGILLIIYSKLQLLVINWAVVPARLAM
ncbi:hypothetical protein, partial [Ferruginibacter sp.]|nr:hypothetical protein [Ferruginibacter sp.]